MITIRKFQLAIYFWSVVLLLGLASYSSSLQAKLKVYTNPLRQDYLGLPKLPALPVRQIDASLNLTAKSYASLDTSTGTYLLGKEVFSPQPPASLSKLLLAWIVRQRCGQDQVITISNPIQVGTTIGLKNGERWSVESLLYATLVPSANDAAEALAEGCFGSQELAVKSINEKSSEWGLKDSHFTNSTGLDQERNYTTAADLARMTELVLRDGVIAKIVKTTSITISSVDKTSSKFLKNTNKLLGQAGVDGVKTGSTEAAGENLIVSANLSGHRVIAVVLGSSDRFTDAINLLAEIARVYRWEIEDDLYFGAVLGDSNTGE